MMRVTHPFSLIIILIHSPIIIGYHSPTFTWFYSDSFHQYGTLNQGYNSIHWLSNNRLFLIDFYQSDDKIFLILFNHQDFFWIDISIDCFDENILYDCIYLIFSRPKIVIEIDHESFKNDETIQHE